MVLISVLAQRFDVAISSFKQLCRLEDRTESTSSQSDGAGQELAYINSLLLHGLVQANLFYEAHELKTYLMKDTSVVVDIPTSTAVVPQGPNLEDNLEYNNIQHGANFLSMERASLAVLESPCSRSSRLKRETLVQAKQQFDVVLDNLVRRATPTTPARTMDDFRKSWKLYDSAVALASTPRQSKFHSSNNGRATAMDYPEYEKRKHLNLHINVSKADSFLTRNDQPDDDRTQSHSCRDGKTASNAHIYRSQASMLPEDRLHTTSNGIQELLRTHGETMAPQPTCDATSPASVSTMSQSNFGTPTARYSARLKGTVNHVASSSISDETQWLTFRHGRQTPSPNYNDRVTSPNDAQTKLLAPTLLSPNTLLSDDKVLPANCYGTCSIASEDSQSFMGYGLLTHSASKETSSTCSTVDESTAQCSPPRRKLVSTTTSSPTRDRSKSRSSPVEMNPLEDTSSKDSNTLKSTEKSPHSAIQSTKTKSADYNGSEENKHWQMDGYEDFPLHPNLRKGSSWAAEKSVSVGAVANEIQSRVKHGHTLQGRTEYLFLKDGDSTGNGRKYLYSSRSKALILSVSAPNTPADRKRKGELRISTMGEICTSTHTNCNSISFQDTAASIASMSPQSPSPITDSSEQRAINVGKDFHSLGTVGSYDLDKDGRLVEHRVTVPRSKKTASCLSLSKTDYKPSSPLESTDFGHSVPDRSRKQPVSGERLNSRWSSLDEISHSRPPRLGKTLQGLHHDQPQRNESHPAVQSLTDTVFHYRDTLSSGNNTYKSEYLDYDVVHRHVRENFLGGPLSQEDVDPSVTMGSFDIVVDEARPSQQPGSSIHESRGYDLISSHPERLLMNPMRTALHRSSSPRFFKYEQLAYPGPYPAGIQLSHRELYLSDADFKRILGVDKEQWNSLPKWRRILKKREKKLF